MTRGTLDRRTGILFGVGVVAILLLRFVVFADRTPAVVETTETVPVAERRLARLRQLAASVPGKEQVLKQVSAELATREKGMLVAETAAQAQAQLLETARRIGKTSGIDLRGSEDMRVVPMGQDYAEVSVTMSFDCTIEKLVNFLAALGNEPGLIATSDLQIRPSNPKEKIIAVRLRFAGVGPRKLVPEKKGTSSF